jgi:Cu2+-exporting ATPase
MAGSQAVSPALTELLPAQEASAALDAVTLTVENMHCGGCMGKVERALRAQPGVVSARANLAAKRAFVRFDPARTAAEQLIAALAGAGFAAAELVEETSDADEKRNREFLGYLGVAGFASANVMLLSVAVWSSDATTMDPMTRGLFHWVSALIALPTVAYAGQPFFRSAWQGLKARRVNMDVPISLGILLTAAMSLVQTIRHGEHVFFDACVMLLFFLLIGRFLDQRMRTRARGAAQNLLQMRPKQATLILEDGRAERIAAAALAPGMRIAVAAGERFPADGAVVAGRSEIDESLLTGESALRAIEPGADIFAGTVNLAAPVEFEVRKPESQSLLAELTGLMQSAEQARGLYMRLADRASRLYAPLVHLAAALTFAGWILAGSNWDAALMTAIAVLIITCPCALALAVPAVQVAAADRLFVNGTFVKAADGLERLAEIDTVVFDKTGTLTLGKPSVLRVDEVDGAVLRDAAALAASSRHPYALALVEAAKARLGSIARAAGAVEIPGQGLKLETLEGEARLGSADWCGVASSERGDASVFYAAPGTAPVGFSFADTLRPDARHVIAELRAAGFAVEIMSGDRNNAVAPVAEALGIEHWRGECKPQEKIARLKELAGEGRKVFMVGDGLNDAPALAAAHASLSPSSAIDISQMASDAVFQGAKLQPVLELLAVSRRAERMAFQNFAIAGVYNLLFVPIAAAGFVTPLIAAVAMSTSSILVTANALRLRGMKIGLSS